MAFSGTTYRLEILTSNCYFFVLFENACRIMVWAISQDRGPHHKSFMSVTQLLEPPNAVF